MRAESIGTFPRERGDRKPAQLSAKMVLNRPKSAPSSAVWGPFSMISLSRNVPIDFARPVLATQRPKTHQKVRAESVSRFPRERKDKTQTNRCLTAQRQGLAMIWPLTSVHGYAQVNASIHVYKYI